ncbi:MAG: sulfatase-like hydrolase/transferase, partial [Verrucomicrobiales bacterium]
LVVREDSEFGFFLTYDQVSGSEDRFSHRENSRGDRIWITETDHGISSRNLVYYVQGRESGADPDLGGDDEDPDEDATPVLLAPVSEPVGAIVSNSTANSFTRAFHDDSNNGPAGRGNTFVMPDTGDDSPGYEVTGLTLRKDSAQSFSSGDELQLWVFAWDPSWDGLDESAWTQSGTNGMQDSDPLSGTGMTPLWVESYDLEGRSFADESFLTFDFSAAPLYLAENRAYAFLVGYLDGAGTGSAYFQFREANPSGYPEGMEIRTNGVPSENTVLTTRDVTFYLEGQVLGGDNYDEDRDMDGLPDAWEYLYFSGLDETAEGNPDGDGLDNAAEELAGTDPTLADSDGDGLNDEVEVAGATDPLDPDSDDDGLLDGVETGTGVFVSYANTGTDPLRGDSDEDGVSDLTEINLGADPFDASHQPSERPNIVFIMIDDLDTREIGVYGQATLQTPEVDTMASEGMMFTDYYTASPVCQSCRSCLMTGQDSRRAQDRHNSSQQLDPSRVTIAEVLKEAGYATGLVGKWGLGSSTGAPWNQGFDFFCGYLSQTAAHRFFPQYLWKNDQKIYFNQSLANSEGGELYIPGAANYNEISKDWTDLVSNVCSHDVVVAEGLQFIEDHADEPFFLYCAWTPPHAYMYPAATMEALTDEDGLVYDPLDLDQTLINALYPGAPFGGTPESPDFNNHCYASMVSAADRDTGRILDKLEDPNGDGDTSDSIADKTLVIFCSDNGEDEPTFLTAAHLKPGYSDLRGLKRDTYEGGIRAPFIARWPGKVPAGSTSDVIGTFADMLPTFAEMAGLSTPAQITGRSILPVLLGGSEDDLQSRDYHYWYFTEGVRRWRAVRQENWKIVRDRDNSGSAPTYELFDLEADPYETTDLSARESERLQRLIPLVEGTHEVSSSTYFKADDEFFSWTNLSRAAYQIGTLDGSGAAYGYTLTPSGAGSCFNYLPFEDGLLDSATFTWTFEFPSGGAASLLLGGVNDPEECLAVRIDPQALSLNVSYGGENVASSVLTADDLSGSRAECALDIHPVTGVGEVRLGAQTLTFQAGPAMGALRFWGYLVESASVRASRPRWVLGQHRQSALQIEVKGGFITGAYELPYSPGESTGIQFSFDLENWTDQPPGLLDLRSTNSQGRLQGSWSLSQDSLLPRNNESLFLRARIAP